MDWHSMGLEETEKALETNFKDGLDEEEAKKRIDVYGENVIDCNREKVGIFKLFAAQLNDFMIIMLIGAAVVSFAVSWVQGERSFVDSIIIIAIVFLNALLGVIQESKAEKAIDELKKLSVPKSKVLRSGHIKEIDAALIVPGDILVIESGDFISADGRVISQASLKADESAITGESLAVSKDAQKIYSRGTSLGDRKNMVLSASYITYGKGRAVVTATGMDTQVGQIAHMITAEDNQDTPLQKRLRETGKTLGIAAIVICAVIFIMGIVSQKDPFEMFMTAVSLAVAAIPEGLPAIVTIVLAIGMQRMSKKNTIIRKLPAVETLGSAEVICSDKTGTLTKNKMKVVKVRDCVDSDDIERKKYILRLATLCNDSYYEDRKFMGEPTETAIAEMAEEMGEFKPRLETLMPRVGEVPFSSERKMMTTVHKKNDGKYLIITKGAPEKTVKICTSYMDGKSIMRLTEKEKADINSINSSMARNALRVIGVSFKEVDFDPRVSAENYEKAENELTFAGLIGMIDPPRDEAAEAVFICQKAGIKVAMITGDHKITAETIGRQLGICQDESEVITGEELDLLSQKELERDINKYSIFARVSPEHKVRIVNAFKKNEKVVAMTGDGVNDAPALKAADIGCAMGENGTDVAKGAADMIITDDNFATIVSAVREGRGIYINIRKAVHFLLSSNVGEILTVFLAMIFGWSVPLLPIQLLWLNLVTDSLPAIALGLDPVDADIMESQPRKAGKSLFTDGLGERIALEGCMIGLLALIAFGIGHLYFDADEAHLVSRTMAFAVLSISQLVHAFNMRTEKSIFSINILSNKYLVWAFIIGMILQVSVIMIPWVADIFLVMPLNIRQWGIVILLSVVPIFIVELEKVFAQK